VELTGVVHSPHIEVPDRFGELLSELLGER